MNVSKLLSKIYFSSIKDENDQFTSLQLVNAVITKLLVLSLKGPIMMQYRIQVKLLYKDKGIYLRVKNNLSIFDKA